MEKALNIKDILSNDLYIIPRYQRNYAWGKAEISQLIKDINDYFYKPKSKTGTEPEPENSKSYYLGSLVCFKREDGSFELIDGQQRHTTLTLINLVLKHMSGDLGAVSKPNLKFDSRKKSQNYIEKLYSSDKDNFLKQATELNISGLGSFKDAIDIIQEELREELRKKLQEELQEELQEKNNIELFADNFYKNFANNFYKNVYLFRVEVPEDTDLNHYFEIMNNRGEQLEKHEIVKALLMGKFKDEQEKLKKQEILRKQENFAIIWDACADMSNYVFFNFDKNLREKLFTKESDLIEENVKNIFDKESESTVVSDENRNAKGHESTAESSDTNSNTEDENPDLLVNIIKNHNIPTDFLKEKEYIKDKYKSVIDFPNFLLQVLKIKNNQVSLDDKKLLKEFNDSNLNPKDFIFDLLKYRTLFDKYVIKQNLADADESKQNWGIRKLNSDFETNIKTFNQPDENDDELLNLQVMLYYSDSTNTYNNWLQEVLKNTNSDINTYTEVVWKITKSKFDRVNLNYPNISIYNLYFIDFLLWKLYAENIKGNDKFLEDVSNPLNNLKKIIDNKKDVFNQFKFRQLNSREHLYSQAQAELYSYDNEIINGIGNLCLISTSQNSAGNDRNPTEKRKMFITDSSSLKRVIMFESYENDKWEAEQINKHKYEIEELINFYLPS